MKQFTCVKGKQANETNDLQSTETNMHKKYVNGEVPDIRQEIKLLERSCSVVSERQEFGEVLKDSVKRGTYQQ